ncbi:MAG: NAD(+) diphosphatase [Xanthomonadaceae bacterium]|nr:NAD(+) diphosphatase [Xanthomonadaceae bacterium]
MPDPATWRRYAFVDEALDRADALRENHPALSAYWHNARVIAIDAEGKTRSDGEGRLLTLRGGDVADDHRHAIFLGLRQDEAWFAHADDHAAADPARATAPAAFDTASAQVGRTDLRTAAAQWPAFESTVFAQARAVLFWRSRHRHCGVCGGRLEFARGGWLGRCTVCGAEHYPRTDPAVIVAVTDGERLLLGRQASWPPRRYSTLAGFVEPGETLEQTVAREVMEESSVRVLSSVYIASQPWPFPSSLMLGFVAEAEPDPPQANEELEDARWFSREEIGAALRGETREDGLLLSPSISISRALIECWYRAGEPAPQDDTPVF